jgi:hypothetical protein
MTSEKKSDLAFNLVIDEDRAELMQILSTCLLIHMDDFVMSHPDRVATVVPALKSLMKDFSIKQHEMGWCKDPHCKFNEHIHE